MSRLKSNLLILKITPFLKRALLPVFILLTAFLLILALIHSASPAWVRAQTSFSFGAGGDFGGSSDAKAVLSAIPASTDLFFALGDLAYSAANWCATVRASVPETFPFELIAGNHDDDVAAPYNIDTFTGCLPDKIGSLSGLYGKEYYVDYPSASPLTRFIMISPHLTFTNAGSYAYTAGSSHYNWLAQAIDGARSAGITWVVVGMHENCITMGVKSCSIGSDLINLLVAKKVDLILQAHDHDYQRSKQFALSSSCAALVPGTYNPACVADDGADNQYSKGAGSVLVIVGTAGQGLYNVSTGDSEAGYFAAWMGANSNPRKGFSKFTVSQTEIQAQFIGTSAGSYTDSFVINGNTGSPPTPTTLPPTAAPTPTTANLPTITSSLSPSPPTAGPSLPPTAVPTPTACPQIDSRQNAVSLTFNTAINKNYQVFSRIKSAALNGNSFYMTLDNGCPLLAGGQIVGQPNVWEWTSPALLSVSRGAHILTLTGNDDLLGLDRILLTEDTLACTPINLGGNCLSPGPSISASPSQPPQPKLKNVLNPRADAFVSARNPKKNYGQQKQLQIDGSPKKITYLEFDLSSLPDWNKVKNRPRKRPKSVKLRLFVTNVSRGTQRIRLSEEKIAENTLTYSNRPKLGRTIGTIRKTQKGKWVEADLSRYEIFKKLPEDVLTIAIESSQSDDLVVSSREADNRAPKLVVKI